MSTAAEARSLADAISSAQSLTGGGTNYLKFDKGEATFQFFLDNNGLPFLKVLVHRGKSEEGKFSMAADLQWISTTPDLASVAVDKNVLTEEDLDLIAEFGDPATRLYNTLVANGMDPKDIRDHRDNPSLSVRVLWNAVKDGESGLLETSNAFAKWFAKTGKKLPDLLNREIIVEGEGDGLRRSYDYIVLPDQVDAVDVEPIDLIEQATRKIIPFNEKVEFVLRSYPELVAESGLNREDFGG